MQPWIVIVIIVAIIALGWVAHRFGWIDLSNKSRTSGGGGGIASIGDEVFNPTRHEAQVELDRQTILPAPAPLPGDRDFGLGDFDNRNYDGQVRIDLSAPVDLPEPEEPKKGRHSAAE